MAVDFLLGNDLITHLAPLIDVDPRKVRQIIIVASVDNVAMVYVELFGTKKLIKFDPSHLEHAKIKIVSDKE